MEEPSTWYGHPEAGASSLGGALPFVIEAGPGAPPLAGWVARHRARIEAVLARSGALLLRGFGLASPQDFAAAAEAASDTGRLMDYRENTSPRSPVWGNVKTSTDYPAGQRILLHNEHSYSRRVPRRLFFGCVTAATEGGATTLADCRRVLARLDPRIVADFEARGWMYVRNFRNAFGPSWQDVFQTSSEEEVAEHCRRADIECAWGPQGALTLRHVRRAVARHPATSERAWFNHIAFWNMANLQPRLRDVILADLDEADYPNQTYYGDGDPIEHSVIEALNEAYAAEEVGVDWQDGDVLVVDNILVAHGRRPFRPPRLVLFAMADPIDGRGL